ncbi:MAG: hypothetical protein VKK04_04300 [Synechococcales bacterium]|nr:hypothetical protein [Synechococcales bacterium]
MKLSITTGINTVINTIEATLKAGIVGNWRSPVVHCMTDCDEQPR